MRTVLVVSLLALAGLAFVPEGAAIPHPCEDKPAENTCRVVVDTALDTAFFVIGEAGGYGDCYYSTAPENWTTTCV